MDNDTDININQQKLKDRLTILGREMNQGKITEAFGKDVVIFWSKKDFSPKSITIDSYHHYLAILNELLSSERVARNFTKKEIEKYIKRTLDNVIDSAEPIEEKAEDLSKALIEDLKTELDHIGRWEFATPVLNLNIENPPLKIGKVTLSHFGQAKYEEWLSKERKILEKNPNYDDEQVENLLEQSKKYGYSLIDDHSYAETVIKGRVERSKEDFRRKVGESLNAIKLYWSTEDDRLKRYFGLPGSVIFRNSRGSRGIILGRTKSFDRYHHSPIAIGALYQFNLDNQRLQDMRDAGFEKLCTLLGKDDYDEIERRIIGAINWFGKGVDVLLPEIDKEKVKQFKNELIEGFETFNLGDRFLKMMISLETLLIVEYYEKKSENIALRTAYILGKNKEDRRKIYNELKEFYKMRSMMVHEGLTSITSTEVNTLMVRVQKVIIGVLSNKDKWNLQVLRDLQEWSLEKKLG